MQLPESGHRMLHVPPGCGPTSNILSPSLLPLSLSVDIVDMYGTRAVVTRRTLGGTGAVAVPYLLAGYAPSFFQAASVRTPAARTAALSVLPLMCVQPASSSSCGGLAEYPARHSEALAARSCVLQAPRAA
jgi:hypothetical protein